MCCPGHEGHMIGDGIDLTVTKLGAGNTDRRIARLTEGVRRELGVLSGDPIVVSGDDAIIVTVWPAAATQSTETIALSPTARSRANVTVGETVRVSSERVADATHLTIRTDGSLDPDTVRAALRNRPVASGDRYQVENQTVAVHGTRPNGTVHVTDATTIRIRTTDTEPPDTQPAPGTQYSDIGGLETELELVREAVELPLSDPDTFDRLGIEPPTGVLLYGPPGTGKTLIAEAVATAADAAFYHVSGPEITSKYKGESEERLREIFETAREEAPAIIFFDEIDALAGEREGSDMESRVVAQLLSLMDGLTSRGNVVVIGATNRVDALDPALRRPGRFDREIEIGVPDEAGRRDILQIHTADVPTGDDVDIDRLAARTHGFVGADLRALVTEAAMIALRRADTSPVVQRADFETAMATVDPSAMREFVAETPDTSFTDVGGLRAAKDTLSEAVEWPLAYPALFEASATEPPSGILLHGPPGTGKTLLARALAGETDVNFVHVAGPELIDKYVGESEKAVREVFERARQSAPSIVFFDEIDAIAGRRTSDDDVTNRVVSQLLAELDGLADTPNVIVLAATNRKDSLDPALLRPGRLETHVHVPQPDESARRDILRVHTREKPLATDVDLAALAADLEGATGADIAALVREASLRAIREFVEEHGSGAGKHADALEITAQHFRAAMAASD